MSTTVLFRLTINNTVFSTMHCISVVLESPSWERQKHLEAGPRLWHAAVNVNQATLMIVGMIIHMYILGDP